MVDFSNINDLWERLRTEATLTRDHDRSLEELLQNSILGHGNIASSIGYIISSKLASPEVGMRSLKDVANEIYVAQPDLLDAMLTDLKVHVKNDPAVFDALTPYLFFKGFHGLQAYRLANALWKKKRHHLALFIQSRMSEIFDMDIHPAATIEPGIMMDHATGIVIGETAIVESGVLFWHNVTLGGKGIEGRRHPLVRRGAKIGAHAILFGQIEIGENAVIDAGSTVVKDIPANSLITGPDATQKR